MLGRWQPWHTGHQRLFEEAIKRTGQVLILVRDTHPQDPYSFIMVKETICKALLGYEGKYKVALAPNITNIIYGCKVGYKIERVHLPEDVENISATDIREAI